MMESIVQGVGCVTSLGVRVRLCRRTAVLVFGAMAAMAPGLAIGDTEGLAGAAAGPAPASALQDAPSPPSPPKWFKATEAKLGLTPQQKPAWQAYFAAMSDTSARPTPPSLAQLWAMPLPQRVDMQSETIAADLATVRMRAKAIRQLYDILSAYQRRILDEATTWPSREHPALTPDTAPPPDKPNYRLPSHTAADWMIRPNADDVSRVYPSAAAQKGIAGKAVLRCTADEQGYLTDCVVVSEAPANQGFGNAALEMTGYMRMQPATDYGIPVRDSVNIPSPSSRPSWESSRGVDSTRPASASRGR